MEKRGWITWYMWKANKVLDKELAPSMLGHRRPFEYWRVPRLGLSLLQILEARISKYTWWASTTQMGIQPKKGRKERHGEPSISARLKTLFSKSAHIPQVVHKEIMEYAELCRGSSPDPHWDQAFFCIPSHIQKVSGGLHYLLAKSSVNIFMALFLDKCLSIRKTLFP